MGKQEIKQNYYFDSAVGGYLMISVGTAFISTTTFKEILKKYKLIFFGCA